MADYLAVKFNEGLERNSYVCGAAIEILLGAL
jgi:hypothetical protein